jgi:hypothetical protein
LGQTAISDTNTSGLPFIMGYNLFQAWNFYNTDKNEGILRNDNGLGGYTIRLNSTDFSTGNPTGQMRRAIFTQAVKDWVCMTGANLIIGSDTSIVFNSHVNDGTNYISFTSDSLSITENAKTFFNMLTCSSNLNATDAYEVDMLFNANQTWVYDTTVNIPSGQVDFYGVCLHELGHFLGLAHNVKTNELMYYGGNTGFISAANRKRLLPNTDASNGGIWSVNYGAGTNLSCLGLTEMIKRGCGSVIAGIEQLSKNNFFFNLYPNPSDGSNINIDFQAPINTNAQLIIYDMMGRIVYTNNLNDRNEINSAYSLDVSNLASGVYMVNLVVDNIKVCQKLIKN